MYSKPLIITEDVANGFIRGFNLVPPLYRYESITDGAAEMLAKSKVHLDLDGVDKISINAILHIVERQDDFCLGISEITNDQAEAMKGFRKRLSLNNLKDISLSALKILVSTPKEFLGLNGLVALSPEQASLLAQFRGELSLEGISQMPQEVAQHLARHVGILSLGNLKVLTTEEIRYLIGHQGDILLNATLRVQREGAYLIRKHFNLQVNAYSQECYLEDCLADGTDAAIATARKSLATAPKTLCLDSMNVLLRSGAKVLAEFPGELQLPGLEELDPEVALFLSKHNGPSLAIDGLSCLTVPVAGALGKHRGALLLRGIKSFEEGSPSLLALHDGSLILPLPSGGNDKYGWFKVEGRKAFWKPSGIDHHDLAVMGEILNSHTVEIEIPEEVHFVSNTVLSRLGYACRVLGQWVAIPGLRQINLEQSQLLTASHLKKTDATGPGSLALDGLLELNEPVAEELGKSGLSLSLSSLNDLSSGILRLLTQDINDLALCGLKSVDEEGCNHLASVPGQLQLDGIKILPVACAAAISSHKGRLTLNGLQSVSEEQAKQLTRHDGTVELKGIKWVKMNSALLNGFIEGVIIVDELEVFRHICRFCESLGSKPSHDLGNCREGIRSDDSAMPELVARILIEHLSRCLDIVERAKVYSPPAGLLYNKMASEIQIFSFLSTVRRNPPKTDITDLISYVTERYFDREISAECDEHSLPILGERKVFDRRDQRQVLFRKICGCAANTPKVHSYDIERYRPELKPIIEAYIEAAKRIMCSGLTGESDISCVTLVLLGCLFGKWVDLPEVCHLCCKGALALSTLEAELALNGITKLSPEIALLLSHHVGYTEDCDNGYHFTTIHYGSLALNGIEQLDVNTAAALALHQGDTLCLNGLASISDAVADALAQHKGNRRYLRLHGLRTLSPRAAQSLSGCLDKDSWGLVDSAQVETRFAEVMAYWQEGELNEAAEVLDAFLDLSIFLSHQERTSDLFDWYVTLRNSLESKLGKASKPWVSCVVSAARSLANNELSTTELIIRETLPVVEGLMIATAAEEGKDLRFIEWVSETGESDAAHALLERVQDFRRESQSILDIMTYSNHRL